MDLDLDLDLGLELGLDLDLEMRILNGRLFSTRDISLNGNLNIGGNLSVSQFSSNKTITTTNYQLIVSEDLSLNGRVMGSSDASFGGNLYANGYITVGRGSDGSSPQNGTLRVGGAYATGIFLQIQKMGVASWGSTAAYDATRYINCTGNAENTKDFNVGPGGVGIGYAPPAYSKGGADGLYVNGLVGIGTTNPQAALDVSGAIRVSGGITPTYTTPSFSAGQIGCVLTGTSYGLSSITSGVTTSTHYLTLSPGVWILYYCVSGISSPNSNAYLTISTTRDAYSTYVSAGSNGGGIYTQPYVISTTTTYYGTMGQSGSNNYPGSLSFTAVRIA